MIKICAAVVNDRGELLPYTCQSTISQVEEAMEKSGSWDKLKELGARVEQTYLMTAEEGVVESLSGALALLNEMANQMLTNEGKYREPTYTENVNWAFRAREFLKQNDFEKLRKN